MAEKPPIIQLSPSEELTFMGPFNEVVVTLLTIQNLTNERVLFNVMTTAPKNYCVRPNNGEIPPYGREVVEVMLQPFNEARLAEYQLKHKFMVRAVIIPLNDYPTPKDISYAIRITPKTDITDLKLKCVFAEYVEKESTLAQQEREQKDDTTIGAAGIRHRKQQ